MEHFCDKNAVIVVVDFGHLHFSNCNNVNQKQLIKKESDDEGIECSLQSILTKSKVKKIRSSLIIYNFLLIFQKRTKHPVRRHPVAGQVLPFSNLRA